MESRGGFRRWKKKKEVKFLQGKKRRVREVRRVKRDRGEVEKVKKGSVREEGR